MQLSFLGRTYTATSLAIETTETEVTVSFLGNSATVKKLNVAQRQQPSTELTFMGRRYTR